MHAVRNQVPDPRLRQVNPETATAREFGQEFPYGGLKYQAPRRVNSGGGRKHYILGYIQSLLGYFQVSRYMLTATPKTKS